MLKFWQKQPARHKHILIANVLLNINVICSIAWVFFLRINFPISTTYESYMDLDKIDKQIIKTRHLHPKRFFACVSKYTTPNKQHPQNRRKTWLIFTFQTLLLDIFKADNVYMGFLPSNRESYLISRYFLVFHSFFSYHHKHIVDIHVCNI